VTSDGLTGGSINVDAHCTDTVCLIPPGDISKAVAGVFLQQFDDGLAKGLNGVFAKYDKKFKTEFTFTHPKLAEGLGLDTEANWWILPGSGSEGNGFMINAINGGFYTNVSKVVTFPPTGPTFTPPNVAMPFHGVNIYLTEYFFYSLEWALDRLNFFTKTLKPSDVPAASPVQLTTNDDFFQQVVPGLTSYPNMDITVDVSLGSYQASGPTIDSAGLHIHGTNLTFDFILSNKTVTKHGWTLSNIFDVDIKATHISIFAGREIVMNASITNVNATVKVLSSDVGDVSADGFVSLYTLLQSQIKLPGFAMKLPEQFAATNPQILNGEHFLMLGVDLALKPPAMIARPFLPGLKTSMMVNA